MQFLHTAAIIFSRDCINDFVKVTDLVGASDADDLLGTVCLEKLRGFGGRI
jgi:hypothetical protein